MTLFEYKAIEWLKSIAYPRNGSEESYHAETILKLLEGLGDRSVSDLLELVDELEGKVDFLEQRLEDIEGIYNECDF